MVKQIGSQYDFQRIPILGLVAEQKSTAPATPVNGQLWYDTTNNVTKVYDNGAWTLIGNAAVGGTLTVQDENVTVGSSVAQLDFQGAGVVASSGAGEVIVTVSGAPQGAAGGDLAGSYPNPTLGTGKVTTTHILDGTITDVDVNAANKDGAVGTASMRTLGTGSLQAAAGNDSRFGAASPPNGTAGGDLSGTYPNPGIAAGVIVLADLNTALTDGTVGSKQVRAIGTGATDAAAGSHGHVLTDAAITGILAISKGGNGSGTAPAQGGVSYAASTTAYAATAAGTSGQTLLSGGTGAPTWGFPRIDQLLVPTADVPFGSRKITGLADGTAATDAATKGQLDAVSAGLDPKGSVRCATTGVLSGGAAPTGSYSSLTTDNISVNTGDRVLVKDQSATNGIWIANVAGAWTRATDMDTWAEVPGAFVFVEEGSLYADTGWVSTANTGGTLNTTAIPWTQFSGAGAYNAGNGLTQTGTTFDVGAGAGITVAADSVAAAFTTAGGDAGSASTVARGDHAHSTLYPPMARSIATTAPLTGGGDLSANRTLAISNFTSGAAGAVPASGGLATNFLSADGTWKAPPLDTTSGDARYTRKFVGLVAALAAGVETLVTHSLGTQYVVASFFDASTNRAIDFDWRAVSTTQIGITADIAYGASAIRAAVIG